MTDEKNLRKGILLEDFAAVQMKLQSLQAALRKEALLLAEIVDDLQRGGECPITVASALDGYLSEPLRDLIQALQDACDEKEMLQKMLSESGIKV
jgi:hypothetical protein